MIEHIIIVTDLGPGDGGKGGVIHALVNREPTSLILKFGGGQGSHGVVTDGGLKFAFSHWGCGTLENIPTMIAPSFIVIPHAIINEAKALMDIGIKDPFALLSIDPEAICATPFHQIASRLYELAHGDNPRGTVGTGAGAAYRLYQQHGDALTLRMKDLRLPEVVDQKLHSIICYYQKELVDFKVNFAERFLEADRELANEQLELLYDDANGYQEWTMSVYAKLMETNLHLQSLTKVLHQYDGLAIAECSHGVLTDSEVGFRPHVSAIRTLPKFVRQTILDAGFVGRFTNLGVTRAYAIRHGAGPLPTERKDLAERLIPGSYKLDNRWQGNVRVGSLDFNLLKYAVWACDGPERFDGLCITWFDQIMENGKWLISSGYDNEDPELFRYSCRKGITEFARPLAATDLQNAIPENYVYDVSNCTIQSVIEICCKKFLEELKIPVCMISFGANDQNKIFV